MTQDRLNTAKRMRATNRRTCRNQVWPTSGNCWYPLRPMSPAKPRVLHPQQGH